MQSLLEPYVAFTSRTPILYCGYSRSTANFSFTYSIGICNEFLRQLTIRSIFWVGLEPTYRSIVSSLSLSPTRTTRFELVCRAQKISFIMVDRVGVEPTSPGAINATFHNATYPCKISDSLYDIWKRLTLTNLKSTCQRRPYIWLLGRDSNPCLQGYEPCELPGCSTQLSRTTHEVVRCCVVTTATLVLK